MLLGYCRISTTMQNTDRQIDALTKYGVDKSNIYTDKLSGKNIDRPQFKEMLRYSRKGDTIVVTELSRLSRSLRDLLKTIDTLTERGVQIVSLKENIDTNSAVGRMFINVIASLNEFEREIIVERTKQGIESARARGRVGGRPKIDTPNIEKALKLYETKQFTIRQITDMTGVSKASLYRYLKSREV